MSLALITLGFLFTRLAASVGVAIVCLGLTTVADVGLVDSLGLAGSEILMAVSIGLILMLLTEGLAGSVGLLTVSLGLMTVSVGLAGYIGVVTVYTGLTGSVD